ncbi:hypothetical protein CUZ56_00019 [Saezia sanguinis]|uniref:DUF4870 domain-containing protein n=1 Tax=Saezia sanguinis TaxID=1965230 RepID=A0A433SFN7_9BURK|nr:DUF4870 domain-containing protein [Saezia sanguinis]RUS67545.1 hypothetical protein CUZ56_00019 [Saezia sanguinis]
MANNESVSKESKDTAGLMWILAIFFNWLSSLIFYFTKKDDALVHEESKLALNLSINYFIVVMVLYIIGIILAMIVTALFYIAYLAIVAAWIGWIYICYLHFKAVKEGTAKPKIPYAIMFIK